MAGSNHTDQDIFRLLTESVKDHAIILLDTEGNIKSWNSGATNIKGYNADEIIGQHFRKFYTKAEIEQIVPELHLKEAAKKGHVHYEGWRIRKDGSQFWAEVTISALYDNDNRLIGFSKVTQDRTRLKKAEDDKEKIERVLDITNETARIGAWEIDFTTNTLTISRVNRMIREIGDDVVLSPLEGRKFFKEGENRDKVQKALEKCLRDGTPYDLEILCVTATGRELWCRVIGQPELKEGKCVKVFGILQDIDAQKRALIRLEQSEEKFRSSFDLAGIGMGLLNIDGKFILANKRFCEMLGYTEQELFDLTFADITHPDEVNVSMVRNKRLLNGEAAHIQLTKRYIHKSGSPVWVNVNVALVKNESGEPMHYVLQAEDLTEQKKTESEKQKIEEILNISTDSARIGVWEKDLISGVMTWSKMSKEMRELPDDFEPTLEAAYAYFKEGESRDTIIRCFNEAVKNGTPYDKEVILVTASGREVWCRSISQPEFRDGKCVRVFGILMDIDAQKRAQIELRESEEKFRSSFELAGIGMALIGMDQKPILLNKRMHEMLGYEGRELYELSVSDITHPDDRAQTNDWIGRLISGEIKYFQYTKRYLHKTGSIIWVNINVALVRNSKGEPLHFVSEVEDITERKKLEEENGRIQQVLDDLGETAGIGAWEINFADQKVIWSRVTKLIHEVPEDYEPEIGEGLSHYKPGDSLDRVNHAIYDAVATGSSFDIEVQHITALGNERWCRLIGQAEFIDGKPTRLYGIIRDIDSRKRAEIELQESEAKFRNSFELAGIGMTLVSLDHKLMLVNKRFCEMMGYTDQELYALTVPEFTHPDDLDLTLDKVGDLIAGKMDHYQITKRYIHKSGSIIWVNINVAMVRDAQGKPLHCISEIEDITERKYLEEEKGKTQLVLDSVSETARIGAWEIDLATQKIIWSKVAKFIHEVPDDYEVDVRSGAAFYKSAEDLKRIGQVYNNAIQSGTPFDIEILQLTATGREIWCRIIGQPEFVNGKCVRLYGILQDIDSQKRTQIELQLREEQLRRSFDMSALGMSLLTLNGKPIRVNNRMGEILGYSIEEMMQLNTIVVTFPEDVAEDIRLGKQLLAGEIDYYHRVKRFVHKSGTIIWAHVTLSLVRDGAGQPAHFVCEIEDITERKKQEDELKRVNEELTAIFNSGAHVAIIGTDLDGTITHFNKGAERLLGYTADEVIATMTPERLHPREEMVKRALELKQEYGRDIKGFDILVENARIEGHHTGESIFRRKDGTTFPIHQVITPIMDAEAIVGYLGISTDITELKQAETMMRKYAQLEAKNIEMEQFTFIASHDLLQPLQTIKSFVGLLDEEYRDKLDDTAEKYIGFIAGSTGRMIDLVKGLLDYSRLGRERKLESVDCNTLVKDILDDLALQVTESKAEINITHLPKLNVYALEFKQLLQNLITNAIKFRRPDVSPRINISAKKVQNKWTFEVSDNGIGISDKNKELIFVLFQRLHDRHEYEGIGIGLANCKKIVELHNGTIWVESTPGKGSSFYFTIET